MSIEDFLAWEARQERKFEFDGFEPVAMAGGSRNHARIQRNLAVWVALRVPGQRHGTRDGDAVPLPRWPGGLWSWGWRGHVHDDPLRAVRGCQPKLRGGGGHGEKAGEYQAIASLQHYVVLEGDCMAASVSSRDGDAWRTERIGPGEHVELPATRLSIPLAEFYEGVVFAAT